MKTSCSGFSTTILHPMSDPIEAHRALRQGNGPLVGLRVGEPTHDRGPLRAGGRFGALDRIDRVSANAAPRQLERAIIDPRTSTTSSPGQRNGASIRPGRDPTRFPYVGRDRRLGLQPDLREPRSDLGAATFVDRQRFGGAAYRAANWLPIGWTRGNAKAHREFRYHGQPKEVYAYAIEPRLQQLLFADPNQPLLTRPFLLAQCPPDNPQPPLSPTTKPLPSRSPSSPPAK
ncbi:MAG: DUF4338 domain-containing protein [Verrucomicrobia bacterium]|nr:DUF4338 domain-containing protein [Verrucomicrobiota bacterium]